MVSVLNDIIALRERIGLDIIGQQEIVDKLLMGLLCNGNILVEGLPGLAKTRAIKSLSKKHRGFVQTDPVYARPRFDRHYRQGSLLRIRDRRAGHI